MSRAALVSRGEAGFALEGVLDFDSVASLLADGECMLNGSGRLDLDLGAVREANSAGLALLLEWVTWANHTVREISYTAIPERVMAIARTTEVDVLLSRGERWAGFIEAPEIDA